MFSKIDFLIIAILSFILGAGIGINISFENYKKEAIKHECAEYNNITGKFQWITKKVDDKN